MKYSIAYGRNLDLKRMKEKCPHCVLVGKALLKDWQLAFKRHITVEPCKGGIVPVGVWQINEEAEKELDVIEGFPFLYRKEIVKIKFNGKMVEALIYVINDTHPKYPDKAYLNRIFVGYNDFDFDKQYIYDAIKRLPTKKVYILTNHIPQNYIDACNKVGIKTSYGMDYTKVDNCDGLLIPGSGQVDEKRDKLIVDGIRYCIKNDKPILGICLGLQLINVAFGGTLRNVFNHKDITHLVNIKNNCLLHDYLGETYLTNSKHLHGIEKLGKGLMVLAQSKDEVIEAIGDFENKILGVQWHPEQMRENSVFEIFKTML